MPNRHTGHPDQEASTRSCYKLFVRLADGRARVVDVRAGDQIDEASAEAFAATERACRAVGWEFVRLGVPDPVLMANVRWLVRYRRARSARRPDIVDGLLELFAEPGPLRAGAVRVGDPLVVLPHLFHLLWSGALVADLEGELLHSEPVVWTRGTSR
ncbi:TnsA-like heteromeric transposase endonuclease subunit [Streptomyces sp. NPDC029003]|uniref:TnsA-like heteromeric transposase endonuclease subunit n=1 Tax=Streptomyces sp. NPDC029003 TaxID=3155125 RepID=UPI0033DB4A2F